ncbi:MAG: SGNH/GDSL hydrolase family protein [Candidatus Amulumruptor caecigallinarius]|nr:SGNH/GDSL hydrolase family protein [Candidatus Amulumruptor caecigallinarius]
MGTNLRYIAAILLAFSACAMDGAAQTRDENMPAPENSAQHKQPVQKILFIGDSMTGWLSERLNAYGKENGFEVATVVWDGSTIKKWGASPRLAQIVKQQNPDAIFVSLGMNELFESKPESTLKSSLNAIKGAAGNVPLIWVGPPSWPGHSKGAVINDWLASQLGDGHFFRSFDLKLPRQSAKNPHPTRNGIIKWMDEVVNWLRTDAAIKLPDYKTPAGEQMSRGKTFIYKRMKETL